MFYNECSRFDRRACTGSRNGPDSLMFNSYDIGKLKGMFSNNEQYNDSAVSVSVKAGYYDLTVTVSSDLDKQDSWCRWKLLEAMDYVKEIVIQNCRSDSTPLEITIELYTA
ncbi:MAG: hypothetical protein IJY39_13895 [Clostridia bacterium]|nr:hypothetical protein [Clostridia bacterium]